MKKLKMISLISAALLLAVSLSACVFKSGDPVIASLGRAMSVQRYSCAGFVCVTIVSVLLAGILVRFL